MRKITCLLLLLCLLPSFALADKTITLTFTGDITLGGEDYLRTAEDSFFAVYDREGAPCPRPGCEGTVHRIVQSGRSSFWCPTCQR